MKKTLFYTILGICSALSTYAHATVGGGTYIHTFTYNPNNESVYFVENSENGRGCPPVLKKISLVTNTIDTVYSCDQGEQLADRNQAQVEIQKITNGFKPLSQINLSQNNISIDLEYSKEIGTEYVDIKEFIATVFQNNTQVHTQTFPGCKIEQPFTFAGYAIPGFNEKIVMVVSAVNDCFEGGYISEKPFVVGGLKNLNKEYYTNSIKTDSPLVATDGTLTVYEAEKPVVSTSTATTSIPDEIIPEKPANLVLIGIIMLLVGLGFGFFLQKRS